MESISNSLAPNLSFLQGRDPSILAYGQIPCPQDETKRNLNSLYGEDEPQSLFQKSSGSSISLASDTIQVYLRMKPFSKKMRLTKSEEEAYQIINEHTLLTKLPSLHSNCSSSQTLRANDTICKKFIFTNTFGPDTTQLEIFEQTVKQHLENFLNGQTATVMSYGTTNAGKSYTLQGTTSSPGIIPRALESVFCNITPRSTPCYKPVQNTDVVSLDAAARAYEMDSKTKLLLSSGSTDSRRYLQAYRTMQQHLQNQSPFTSCESSNASYSVWVSFAEIYNESIYDLLSNDCQKYRPALKLATDHSGKAFIRDLKMVCVNSGSEAYQLLMAGQHNLKVAATALNTRSSRSHSIFTIKLLKYYKENSPKDVQVSTFSFCDLAGSERLKKTLNAGDRLKEAQNINTSLLVLGRCLKSIFDVQSSRSKHEIIAPFRESKLTRLFQLALSGKEHIALIVNVNPTPNLYVETQNVLNVSAIAQQIVIEPIARRITITHSRFSQSVSQSVTTVTDWDVTDLESTEPELPDKKAPIKSSHDSSRKGMLSEITGRVGYVHMEDHEEVVRENEKLKKEVADLKRSALDNDFKIRQELSNLYTGIIQNLETNFKNRLQDSEEQQAEMLAWSVKQVEDHYKNKLTSLSQRKRSRIDEEDESDDEINVAELEAEKVDLTARVESLKRSVKELRESKEELLIEHNKTVFELSLTRKDLENCRKLLNAAENDIGCSEEAEKIIEELKKQLAAGKDQIKSLKTYLNEAKDDWIMVKEEEAVLTESLKKMEERVLKSSDRIDHLTLQLEMANECLAAKSEAMDSLEDRLNSCMEQLETKEKDLREARDKCVESEANHSIILKEKEELQIALDKCTCQEKRAEKLSEELNERKQELALVKTSLDAIEQGYKDSLESVENRLRLSDTELERTRDELEVVKREKILLEDKILEYEKEVEKLRNDLEESHVKNTKNCEELQEKSNEIASLESRLSEKVEKLNEMSTKHSTDRENRITELEQEISAAKERDLIKEQLLDAHIQRITKLEKEIVQGKDLEEKLSASENDLKNCKEAKENLEKELDENCKKILSLENELQAAMAREQDKENETISLQKEIKNMIQMTTNESVQNDEMEKEIKTTLGELTATQTSLADAKAELKSQEKLFRKQILRLETRLKTHEDNASQLATLREDTEKRQAESEQLQTLNEKLKREIEQKTQELVSFNKNREDTIQRYEALVKRLQEELDTSKREDLFLRQSTPTSYKVEIRKLKDELRNTRNRLEQAEAKLKKSGSVRDDNENINTSDDEALDLRRTRRRGRHNAPACADVSVIELSGSESKRVTRQTALLPPSTAPSVEKRKLRKKKLFAAGDEGCVDIEPTESTPLPIVRSPLSATRSLRNRRK